MTDEEIINALKAGETATFGCNGHNMEVMTLIADLEEKGLVETWDVSGSQETRRAVRWVGELT